jgi:hypothetical protein
MTSACVQASRDQIAPVRDPAINLVAGAAHVDILARRLRLTVACPYWRRESVQFCANVNGRLLA